MALSPPQPLNGQRVLGIPGCWTASATCKSAGLGSGSMEPAQERRRKGEKGGEVDGRQEMRVVTLNVGSLTGRGVEIAGLLKRRRVRVACVQETRWKANDVRKLVDGYVVYNAGESSGRNGVGVIMEEELKECVEGTVRWGSRLILVKMMWKGEPVNVISAYAPQVGSGAEEKERFWEEFDGLLGSIGSEEMIIVGGDLNGHVGKDSGGYGGVHGGWGYGVRNVEGEAVLEAAVAHDLMVVNTMFEKREQHLVTYEAPQGRSQIDLFLVRKGHRRRCRDCKVIPSEWEERQHKVVVLVLRWRRVKEERRKRGVESVKWSKLKEREGKLREKLLAEVDWDGDGTVQELWSSVAERVRKCCREVLGVTKTGGKQVEKETWWWREDVQEAVKAKRMAFRAWKIERTEVLLKAYRQAKKQAKRTIAVTKAKKYDEVYEKLGTREGEKEVYRLAKQRKKERREVSGIKRIRGEGAEILTEDEAIKSRWEGYFSKLLNEGVEDEVGEDKGDAASTGVETIGVEEVRKALGKMKVGKAVGPDGIPVEVWKVVGEKASLWLLRLFNKMLVGERMPDEWRSSWLVPLYKGKGDVLECKNYRGIKLLSHTMKLWERVVDSRLRGQTKVSGAQFGFVPGRSTMEPIFMLRQLMEKYRRRRRKMHMVFVDLEKAYDRVPRSVIWEVLRKRGVDSRYIEIVKDMYRGIWTSVKTVNGASRRFEVKIGVHQGSVLSPYLFILVLDELVRGNCREAPWCVLFADDMVLVGDTVEEVQGMLEKVREALEGRGLKVNRDKTQHMETRWKGEEGTEGVVKIQDTVLQRVREYRYLGSVVQENGEIEAEVTSRVQAGWRKWKEASGVLCDRRVPMKLKGRFYGSVVRSVMLYGAECWAVKKGHEKKLQVAEMRMLRLMCGVTRRDRIRNTQVRGSLGVEDIGVVMRRSRLRWYGHVVRKEEGDVVARVWREEVQGGKLRRGRPEQTWDWVVRKDMEERGLTEVLAYDRAAWRAAIHDPTPARLGKRC